MSTPRISASPRNSSAPDARSVIAYLPIESISPDPKNPRVHRREQVRAIARSIEAFGFNAPILVDKKNRIVAGHGRLEAAKLLGMTDVPVVRLEHLSEQKAKAYLVSDNKLTDRSHWDDGKLALCLKELQEIALDFEIEATGFEVPEIDFRIQSLDTPLTLTVRAELRRLGKEKRLIVAAHAPKTNPDEVLIKAIVRGHQWFELLKNRKALSITDIANAEKLPRTYVGSVIPFALLAPDITSAILEGTQPIDLNLDRLINMSIPIDWTEQRSVLGFK